MESPIRQANARVAERRERKNAPDVEVELESVQNVVTGGGGTDEEGGQEENS